MLQTPHDDIEKALRICGPENFSYDGDFGTVFLKGHFASAIKDVIYPWHETRAMVKGKEVRLSRGGPLEIRIDGDYLEGQQVRSIIHKAARLVEHQYTSRLKDLDESLTFQSKRWLEVA